MQRVLLQYYKPENRREVIQALLAAGRPDLIGTGPHCLVPPDRQYLQAQRQKDGEKTRPGGGKGPGGPRRGKGRPGSRRGRR